MEQVVIDLCVELAETAWGDNFMGELFNRDPEWMQMEYPDVIGFIMQLRLAALDGETVSLKLKNKIISMTQKCSSWFGDDPKAGIKRIYGITFEEMTPKEAVLMLEDLRALIYKLSSYKYMGSKYWRRKKC